MAEIPTYQARQQGIDPNVYARRLAAGLHVRLGGRAVPLVPVEHALAFPMGVGGLHTMRLEFILRGPPLSHTTRLTVSDTNYADRIGWKEILVGASTHSISDELRAYPKSLLQSPLDVTSATATVAPTHDPVPGLRRGKELQAPDRVADSGFTRLIAQGRLSVLVILASLAAALFWGAAHALSPGHGKTIVTAYLIGKHGTARDAAALGAIVTVTHTIGVFALGLVTLALSQWIVPDSLYPWMNLIAGVLVVAVGLSVLHARVARVHYDHTHPHHDHDHHGHEHAISGRSLLAVGVSGGILPCPSALVVLLAAISLHRLAFGLVLIVAFSTGLALSITGLGLMAVLAKRTFAGRSFDGLLIRALPAVSAAVILAAGVLMTVHAIPKVHA
jgi:ABC-type nickel/cobalt efflux system permease component RcnA